MSRPNTRPQPSATAWDRAFTGPTLQDRPAPPRPAKPARGSGRHGRVDTEKRRDIQGLRMVAVVAVVANHLTGHPRGAFVGVDVFFVISGYLITGLLVRDLGKGAGPVRYVVDFYKRRIRRLFPAALLTIVLTIVAADWAYTSSRFDTTRADGLWASVFWANWHSADAGTDYFTANGPVSPFQHYWSLSVEEQFYVVWPLALFLAAVAVRRRGSIAGRRWTVGVLSAVAIVASVVYGTAVSSSDPTVAYFSTFTRGWELALGALLAVVVPSLRMTPPWLTVMSWAGTACIAVSLFLAHGGAGFPVPGAILPCVGSALVIAAVSSDGARALNGVLTNRWSVFVGDVSYSVYLVHFPVVILLAAYIPGRGAYYYAGAVLLIAGLSAALYAGVEQPVLNSRWLRGGERKPMEGLGRILLVGVAAVAVGAAAVTLWPGEQAQQTQRQAQVDQALAAAPIQQATASTGPEQKSVTRELKSALAAPSWPKLHPSIDAVLHEPRLPADTLACTTINLAPASRCTFGPASAARTIYLAGDSTSAGYVAAFRKIVAADHGWKVRVASGLGCQFVDPSFLVGNRNQDPHCASHNAQVVADIKAARPDLVVVTNYQTTPQLLAAAGLEIDSIARYAKAVAVLAPPVPGKDPSTCYTPASAPVDCSERIPRTWVQGVTDEAGMARVHGAPSIDSTPWFCAAGYCPEFAGALPVKLDKVHAANEYLRHIAPVMLEAFRAKGLLR